MTAKKLRSCRLFISSFELEKNEKRSAPARFSAELWTIADISAWNILNNSKLINV
jgi:hypothetical protein